MADASGVLRDRMIAVLQSPSAMKINFRLANYYVNGWSFQKVIGLLKMHAVGVVIDPNQIDDGGLAEYKYPDYFVFRTAQFGSSPFEKAVILHECVHCWIDSLSDGKYHRKVDNEGAAYVAAALYYLDVTGETAFPDEDDLGTMMTNIAKKIMASRMPVPEVTRQEVEDLETAVIKREKGHIDRLDRDGANGIAYPFSILAPFWAGGS
jgi:hypothetical protein